MLEIKIRAKEGFNNSTQEFVNTKEIVLCLEHSLVSVSKWEAKYKKPFISDDKKTEEETKDYIKFMTVTQNVDPIVYNLLSKDELKRINDYIDSPATATKFYENKIVEGIGGPKKRKNETITSELIYYWMISFQIPFECQKWHLNRLLTLIRICSIKEKEQNGKGGKMSKRDILSQNNALNAARRMRMKSKG